MNPFVTAATEGARAPVATAAVTLSFEAFYRAEYGPLVRLARGLAPPAIAEDMVQESLLALERRWKQVSTVERPDLYARRAVVNRCRSFHRRVAAEARAVARLRLIRAPEVRLPEEDDELWAAVRSLSRRQAQAVVLVYVDGCSHREAAEVLGCAENTVGVHLHRARRALETKLGSGER